MRFTDQPRVRSVSPCFAPCTPSRASIPTRSRSQAARGASRCGLAIRRALLITSSTRLPRQISARRTSTRRTSAGGTSSRQISARRTFKIDSLSLSPRVVRLALDVDLQKHTEQALENSLRQYGREYGASQGATVLMDVDGAVRAM